MLFGHDFINKIVQVQITLPRPKADDFARMVETMLGDHGDRRTDEQTQLELPNEWKEFLGVPLKADEALLRMRTYAKMVAPAFRDNPRQMKQFVYALRLRCRIWIAKWAAEGSSDPPKGTIDQLAKMTAIAMRWPTILTDFQQEARDNMQAVFDAWVDAAEGTPNVNPPDEHDATSVQKNEAPTRASATVPNRLTRRLDNNPDLKNLVAWSDGQDTGEFSLKEFPIEAYLSTLPPPVVSTARHQEAALDEESEERSSDRGAMPRKDLHADWEKLEKEAGDLPLAEIRLAENVTPIRLRQIPPGAFQMGSLPDEDGHRKNETLHKVNITRPYWLSECPITQVQWNAVMDRDTSYFRNEKDSNRRPVETVSWHEAKRFCDALSRKVGATVRLPSKAEWERACRAESSYRFCFGDDDTELGGYAWFHANSQGETHAVGDLKANAFGLYDMHGNVWEWCNNYYSEYDLENPTDPKGPKNGTDRVLRGGGWNHYPALCRSAGRRRGTPDARINSLGFRVAVDLE